MDTAQARTQRAEGESTEEGVTMTPVNSKRCKIKRMVHNTVPLINHPIREGFCVVDGKKIYPNIKAGWSAINYIRANGNDTRPRNDMRPYLSESCGHIHIGHYKSQQQEVTPSTGVEHGAPSTVLSGPNYTEHGPSTKAPVNARGFQHRGRTIRRKTEPPAHVSQERIN